MSGPGPAAAGLIRREALVGAGVNALINAGISGWLLAGNGPQALSVDSIASREHGAPGGLM